VFFTEYGTTFQAHLLEKHLIDLTYLLTTKILSTSTTLFSAREILKRVSFTAALNKIKFNGQFYLITFTKNKECSK